MPCPWIKRVHIVKTLILPNDLQIQCHANQNHNGMCCIKVLSHSHVHELTTETQMTLTNLILNERRKSQKQMCSVKLNYVIQKTFSHRQQDYKRKSRERLSLKSGQWLPLQKGVGDVIREDPVSTVQAMCYFLTWVITTWMFCSLCDQSLN